MRDRVATDDGIAISLSNVIDKIELKELARFNWTELGSFHGIVAPCVGPL